MKAMRGRIALQQHCMRNGVEPRPYFAWAFGVRTRPRVALYTTGITR
jgi:hypothetical protein